MAKYKILSPIYFDGVLFPADTIVDTNILPISGECLVERSWGEAYDGDAEPVSDLDVLRAAMPQPVIDLEPSPVVEPIDDQQSEPVSVPPVEAEHTKRKRKS